MATVLSKVDEQQSLVTYVDDFSRHMVSGSLSEEGIHLFQQQILTYYHKHGRVFVWRKPPYDPYHIIVSEVMLQQTQTHRVIDKFIHFIDCFPTVNALAEASLHDVLSAWQGLGYNRRGQALHKLAHIIVTQYHSTVPSDVELLDTLPGIGPATAASVAAFAFNQPTVFIETNIRAVYIQAFFSQDTNVKDAQLLPLVERTLYRKEPRIWYYALMDYGVMLKKHYKNPSRRSAHHQRQSTFEGSERQIRGMIIRVLTHHKRLTFSLIGELIPRQQERIIKNLDNLCQEGLISYKDGYYQLGT
jgi:A/G-specific adenine glycosylase